EVLFAGVAQKSDQDQIKVQPDKMSEYKDVAMVMAAAQRLNVKKIGISANGN
ncbi:MAG: biopolymer transporter ExbD, partial [Acinetobacter sp.]